MLVKVQAAELFLVKLLLLNLTIYMAPALGTNVFTIYPPSKAYAAGGRRKSRRRG